MFGPADGDFPTAPHQISVALVGSAQAVDGIRGWLQRCQNRIEAKDTKAGQENLHQPFPDFSADSQFGADLVFDDALVREISERQLRRLARADVASATAYSVEIYADVARLLAETGRCRVVICARPDELNDREDRLPSGQEDSAEHEEERDEPAACPPILAGIPVRVSWRISCSGADRVSAVALSYDRGNLTRTIKQVLAEESGRR